LYIGLLYIFFFAGNSTGHLINPRNLKLFPAMVDGGVPKLSMKLGGYINQGCSAAGWLEVATVGCNHSDSEFALLESALCTDLRCMSASFRCVACDSLFVKHGPAIYEEVTEFLYLSHTLGAYAVKYAQYQEYNLTTICSARSDLTLLKSTTRHHALARVFVVVQFVARTILSRNPCRSNSVSYGVRKRRRSKHIFWRRSAQALPDGLLRCRSLCYMSNP